MKTKLNITACNQCPWVTNTRQQHDDAFTSVPLSLRWWCEEEGGPEIIENANTVAQNCPREYHLP